MPCSTRPCWFMDESLRIDLTLPAGILWWVVTLSFFMVLSSLERSISFASCFFLPVTWSIHLSYVFAFLNFSLD